MYFSTEQPNLVVDIDWKKAAFDTRIWITFNDPATLRTFSLLLTPKELDRLQVCCTQALIDADYTADGV